MVTYTVEEVERLVAEELPRWILERPALREQLQIILLSPEHPLVQRRRMTYAEFLEWADEDTLAEWVAVPGTDVGEVVMTSPASNKHQDIARFLTTILSIYVETQQLGIVRPAPFQMKLGNSGREPDLLFVAAEHLDRLKPTYLDGPADWVVEIASPESAERDRGTKFYEYARGGVPEYWLIDPQAQWIEFYQLEETHYRLAFAGRDGWYESLILPGFRLRVEWLWQTPLPHPLRALGEITGADEQVVERFLEALRGTG
jgi:Uma2 family endonuclease